MRAYAKAITGLAVAAVGAAATVVTALDVHATWVPVLLAVATALGVGGGVAGVPNKPRPGA